MFFPCGIGLEDVPYGDAVGLAIESLSWLGFDNFDEFVKLGK
jgi:hypothetical protein